MFEKQARTEKALDFTFNLKKMLVFYIFRKDGGGKYHDYDVNCYWYEHTSQ